MSAVFSRILALALVLAASPVTAAYLAYVGVGDHLVVIDTGTREIIRTIPFPSNVVAGAVSPDGSLVYVHRGTHIEVVDPDPGVVLASWPTGASPTVEVARLQLALSRDGSRLYTIDRFGSVWTVRLVDTATGSTLASAALSGGQSGGMAVNQDATRVYIAHSGNGGQLLVLDGSSLTIMASVPSPHPGIGPHGLALADDDSMIYVGAGFVAAALWAIDPETLEVVDSLLFNGDTAGSGNPWGLGLAVSPDGQRLVFTSWPASGGPVGSYYFSTKPLQFLSEVLYPNSSRARHGVAFTPDGGEIYTVFHRPSGCIPSNCGTGEGPHIDILDAQTFTVITTLSLPGTPVGSYKGSFMSPGPRVAALAADPGDGDILYAAGRMLGVFRSTDGGQSWTRASDGLPGAATVQTLRITADGGAIYALLRNGWLYRSTDQAQNWTRVDGGLGSRLITSFELSPDEPLRVYAATDGFGVWRSDNGGDVFAPFNEGLGGNQP